MQPKRHRLCMYYTETNPIVFISHIIAPRQMLDDEIISNRCNHFRLCNRSLDGNTIRLQNGGRPSDVAQSHTSSSKCLNMKTMPWCMSSPHSLTWRKSLIICVIMRSRSLILSATLGASSHSRVLACSRRCCDIELLVSAWVAEVGSNR